MGIHQGPRFTITATANSGHLELTLNWVASLQRHGYHKFVILCFDFELFSELVRRGFEPNVGMAPPHWCGTEISPIEESWMSTRYNDLTQAKLRIQHELLVRNHSLLFSDVDLVFTSPHVHEHLEQVFSTPKGNPPHLAYMYDQDTDMNTGFFAARPTEMVIRAFANTLPTLKRWGVDQLAFNYQLRTVMEIRYNHPYLRGLDKLLYANGLTFHRRKLNQKYHISPLVIHANYVTGKAAKRELLQQGGGWYL